MELTRIFKTKKTFFFIVVLLSLNVIFYVKDQYTNQYHLSEQKKLRQECVKRYQQMDLQKAADDLLERQKKTQAMSALVDYEVMKEEMGEFLDDIMNKTIQEYEQKHMAEYKEYKKNKKKYSQDDLMVEMMVYGELHDRYCHVLEFQEKLDKIQKNDETMSQVSIFKKNKTTDKSIDKTTKDYLRLKDTTIALGNDDFITSVFSYEKSMYFVFVFVLLVVWQMLAERKKGLWVVVYASARGRTMLALRRVGVLLLSVMAFALVNQGVLFVASGVIYGGETNWSRSIQSIPLFSGFTIPMNVVQFLGVYYVTIVLAGCFCALFTWMLFVAVDNRGIAMCLLLAVYLVGYLLYSKIAEQSYLMIMRYLNFFYFLNAHKMLSSYCNFRLAGQVINRIPMIYILLVSGTIVFAVSGVLAHKYKRPCHRQSMAGRVLDQMADKVRMITSHFSILGMEIYKILIIQKGIVILGVLLYLCVSSVQSYQLYYTPQEEFLNDFYEEYGGPLTEDAVRYLLESEKKAKEKEQEYEKASAAYEEGNLNEQDMEVAEMKHEAASGLIQGSAILRTRVNYLLSAQKAMGEQVWVVNPMGYERLFGEKSYERQVQEQLKIMVTVVFTLAAVFAWERKKGTREIMCATLRGREELIEKKILAGGICALMAFVCVKVTSFISLAQLFPFKCWNAPLKSLSGMAYIEWNGTIGGYYAFVLILQLLAVVVVGMIAGAISAVLPTEMTMIAGMIPLIPSFLDVFGVGILSSLSVARKSAIVEWQNQMGGMGSHIKYWILVILFAGISLKVMTMYWNGKQKT